MATKHTIEQAKKDGRKLYEQPKPKAKKPKETKDS